MSSHRSSARAPASVQSPQISVGPTAYAQRTIVVTAPSRGCHLITDDIYRGIPELTRFRIGTAHLFIKHTSASLSINENCDPDVRTDLEAALNRIVPESWNNDLFNHTLEGPDDMPAHVKSSLVGAALTIPITDGRLNLGTWQGVYLCEHRNSGGQRKIVVTIQGLADFDADT